MTKMKNIIKDMFIFAAGAAIGVVATKKFFQTKYEQIAKEEIESVKDVYTYKKPDVDEDESSDEDEPEPSQKELANKAINKPNVMEYADILKKEGYVRYSDVKEEIEEEDEEEVTHPYVIPPDSFGEDYETVSLTYYADGVLEDDFEGVIRNPEELVGSEYPEHFGEYEDDTVFVRNNEKQIDYEICRDHRPYSEVNGDNELWAAGN